MEGRLFVATLLVVVLASAYGHQYGISFLTERIHHSPYVTCNTGDVSCSSDCMSVQLCLANNQQLTLNNCTGGKTCDTATMTCKANSTTCKPPPDTSIFKCHANGTFPNPFDCHSYFNCDPKTNSNETTTTTTTTPTPTPTTPTTKVPFDWAVPTADNPNYAATGTRHNCTGTTAYDPLSASCRLTSSARVCREGPIPKCEKPTQNGAQTENPNIYYVCVNDPDSHGLVPWLFRCKDITEVFLDGHCVPNPEGYLE